MVRLIVLMTAVARHSVLEAAITTDLPEAFIEHQSLETSSAANMDSFEVDGQHYLFVANHWDAARLRYGIDSKVYQWTHGQRFTLHQRLATSGAVAARAFRIGEHQYLAVANFVCPSRNLTDELSTKCYARGDHFPSELNGNNPGESVTDKEQCASTCESTHHCAFWRFNSDDAWCEMFHIQEYGKLRSTLDMLQSQNVTYSQPKSPFFSGTIVGNCNKNSPDGGRHSAEKSQSKIYKWNNGVFVEYQNIDAYQAHDIETFTVDKKQFLAVAAFGEVIIYHWHNVELTFLVHQRIKLHALDNAWDLETFTIDGIQYMAVANHQDAAHFFRGSSTVFRWEHASDGAFVNHQSLPTIAACSIEAFEVNDVQYLAVANDFDGFSHDMDSNIFRWDGMFFKEHQPLRTYGANNFEAFLMNGALFLAVANHYTSLSKLYRFDNEFGFFAEFQSFNTHSAQAFKAFAIRENQYLVVANKVSASVVYRTPLPCSVANSNQWPGAECACDDGYQGDVTWGSSSGATGECTPAPCNIQNSNEVAGPDCDCKDGYEGDIEWTGSVLNGSCEATSLWTGTSLGYARPLIIAILILSTTAIGGLFVSRKYKRFTDEVLPDDIEDTSKNESIQATVVGNSPSHSLPDHVTATTSDQPV